MLEGIGVDVGAGVGEISNVGVGVRGMGVEVVAGVPAPAGVGSVSPG